MSVRSPNFAFLAEHDELLVKYAGQAERYFADDPNTALIKLRQFAEVMALRAAAMSGVYMTADAKFADVLDRLWHRGAFTPEVAHLFCTLRKSGNAAAHDHSGTRCDAFQQLKMARKLGVWFHHSFGGDPDFKAGPYLAPPDPEAADEALRAELQSARDEALKAKAQAAKAKLTAQQEAQLRAQAEADAKAAYEEAEAAMGLAEETEAQLQAERQELDARLAQINKATEAQPAAAVQAVVKAAQLAGGDLDLNEAETRKFIDAQLRAVGWEVNSEQLRGCDPYRGYAVRIDIVMDAIRWVGVAFVDRVLNHAQLRYSRGVRPAKGRYMRHRRVAHSISEFHGTQTTEELRGWRGDRGSDCGEVRRAALRRERGRAEVLGEFEVARGKNGVH